MNDNLQGFLCGTIIEDTIKFRQVLHHPTGICLEMQAHSLSRKINGRLIETYLEFHNKGNVCIV